MSIVGQAVPGSSPEQGVLTATDCVASGSRNQPPVIIAPVAPDAYTWSFKAHTVPAKKVSTHLSDTKTKAGRGGT